MIKIEQMSAISGKNYQIMVFVYLCSDFEMFLVRVLSSIAKSIKYFQFCFDFYSALIEVFSWINQRNKKKIKCKDTINLAIKENKLTRDI